MNIVEFSHEQSLERNCSSISISTVGSSVNATPESSPRHDLITNHDSQHIQNLTPLSTQVSEMVPQQEQFPVDISAYLGKRAVVMNWLKKYGYQLRVSRNAEAAAQLYSDLYFHNYQFERQKIKMILTSLLILASKNCDYKILFTNHIAYICDLDQRQLNRIELDCCCKMGFDFTHQTYVMAVDRIIHQIKILTGFDLYREDENCYWKLRLIHGVVEKLYTDIYQWNPNQQDILQVFNLVLSDQSTKYPQLTKLLTSQHHNMNSQDEHNVQETIRQLVKSQRANKEGSIRQLFRNREKTDKYCDYAQFSVKYFSE